LIFKAFFVPFLSCYFEEFALSDKINVLFVGLPLHLIEKKLNFTK